MDDVDRPIALESQRLEGRPGQQPEAPGVVGEVAAARWPVQAVAVKGRRVIHQPEPVAVRRDVDDRQVDGPAETTDGSGTRSGVPGGVSAGTGTDR